jgi:TonB family protein
VHDCSTPAAIVSASPFSSWLALAAFCACAWPAAAQEAQGAATTEAPVTAPQVIQRVDAVYPPEAVAAVYPPEAVAAGKEATVVLLVTVGIDGRVAETAVAESAGALLDQASIDAVQQWTFQPARRGNDFVASRIRIPFRFSGPAMEAVPAAAPPNPVADDGRTKPVVVAQPETPLDVTVQGQPRPLIRGASDYQFDVGALAAVPRENSADYLKLAPGVLLTDEGGEAHAEQVFLRGFDAREGQDIEFSVEGTPINESGNFHGNGYSDTHFIIPELVSGVRILEGPFDPHQGNYAVAGSADFRLGWRKPGITTKYTFGSFQTRRLLLVWGPGATDEKTFAGVELYETNGWGEARSGRRATAMAQVAGQVGAHRYRLLATGYFASFHSAGVLREDDVLAGRKSLFSTYDPSQGEDASRVSLSGELSSRFGDLFLSNQAFLIARPIRFRENFTGFLLDPQKDLQHLHPQRGDLIDTSSTEWTLGARGSARFSAEFLGQLQSFESGYFLRGDYVSSQQSRVAAQPINHPYHVDADLDARLGDVGLYLDANLRPLRWIALRGGLRADLFTFDVRDNCPVHSVLHPSRTNPPGDVSCLDQEELGFHREPFQRSSSFGLAYLPRGSVLVGPFQGLTATASIGSGIRSIDPVYVGQDLRTPFASGRSIEAGLIFDHRFGTVDFDLRSVWFRTRVDKDLIFSQTAGRNIIGGPSTRNGSANSARITGPFFDAAANLTYVYATFDEDKLLIPYIPNLVYRFDGALFGELLPDRVRPLGRPFRGVLATGVTYVGRRPLPYGESSNTIFTIDLSASIGWWRFELGLFATNLLDRRYRLGEYNYVSDFKSNPLVPSLVPARHFTAGAPRALFLSLALRLGGDQ